VQRRNDGRGGGFGDRHDRSFRKRLAPAILQAIAAACRRAASPATVDTRLASRQVFRYIAGLIRRSLPWRA
jgi:hypothetical protein